MHISVPVAIPLLASSLLAQPAAVEFSFSPDATAATSRSTIPYSLPGDLVMAVPSTILRGVGLPDASAGTPRGRALGFTAHLQDGNAANVEFFNFVVYGDDPLAPGQPNTSNVHFRTPTMVTPPGVGTASWILQVTFGTPAAVLPQSETWYFGVGLFPGAIAGEEPLSVHMTPNLPLGAPFPRIAHNTRPGAPNVLWTVQPSAGGPIVTQPTPARTHEVSVLVDGVVLHTGADIAPALQTGPNPSFGLAGIYPDNSGRGDGLAFRVRDLPRTGGPVLVLGAPAFAPSPLTAPWLESAILLDPSNLFVVASGSMPLSGEAILQPPALAQGQLPAGINGFLYFQAFTLGARIRASNATATSFQ